MDRIAIICSKGEQIAKYLNQEMENISVETFNNVIEFRDRVKRAPLRADTLLVLDTGISRSTDVGHIRNAAEDLKRVIENTELFEIDRLIFLNKTENTNHREVMEYFKESKGITKKARVLLFTEDQYMLNRIKDILITDIVNYDTKVPYNYVIRKERGKSLKSKYLEQFDTDKSVVVEYSTSNNNIPSIKKSLVEVVGGTKVEYNSIEDDIQIEEIDLVIPEVETIEEKKGCKVIGVIGESKSGCSVTSLILASSASQYEKTLLIDLNYINLGLSYYIEKTLIDDEVNNIKMGDDIIKDVDGLKSLKARTYDSRKLHVLTNSLPVTSTIDLQDYSFFITNMINLLKQYYSYIIIDLPTTVLGDTIKIQSELDKIVLCSTPYMNNLVSMMTKVGGSTLIKSKVFKDFDEERRLKNVTLLRTNIFSKVHSNIKATKVETIDRYSLDLLGYKMKVTGVYNYSGKNYIDSNLFQQLLKE